MSYLLCPINRKVTFPIGLRCSRYFRFRFGVNLSIETLESLRQGGCRLALNLCRVVVSSRFGVSLSLETLACVVEGSA